MQGMMDIYVTVHAEIVSAFPTAVSRCRTNGLVDLIDAIRDSYFGELIEMVS